MEFRGIRSKKIVSSRGEVDGAVLFVDGIIEAVVDASDLMHDPNILDVGDLAVLPGLVDTHVHINEPGRTEWEGFETATQAALAGGVTTLIDMPLNSSPVTTTTDALNQKIESAQGKLWANCGFYGGLVPENADNMEDLVAAGVLGIKAFLIDSGIDEFPSVGVADLEKAMPVIAMAGLPLLAHAEIESATITPDQDQLPNTVLPTTSAREYAASRPTSWEEDAVRLLIDLSDRFGCRVHIVHLSSSGSIPIIQGAREAGLSVSAETCPHYLFFDSASIPDGQTLCKCAPPIRDRKNADDLWKALANGKIDFVASDHSPSPPEHKCLDVGDFSSAWGGIASIQHALCVMWTLTRQNDHSLSDIARWMSAGPAEMVGLNAQKGSIQAGRDADVVVFDPNASHTVRSDELFTRHKLTPYAGHILSGKVKNVFLNGRVVFEDEKFVGSPGGEVLLRDIA